MVMKSAVSDTYKLMEAKRKEEERLKNQASLVGNPEEQAQKQQLIDQAVQAGYGMSDVYKGGAEQLAKATQKASTASKQMAARSLMAATPFGGSAGGAVLPAAAGTGIQAAMAQGQMEQQAARQGTEMGALGQEALQSAAQFAISALPSEMAQNKAMGYISTFYEIMSGEGPDSARDRMTAILASETDPKVIEQVLAVMNA
jgi:hypothetical protein